MKNLRLALHAWTIFSRTRASFTPGRAAADPTPTPALPAGPKPGIGPVASLWWASND